MRTLHAVAPSPCRILKMLTPSVASHAVQRWTLSLSKHHVCTHAHGTIHSLGMADPDTNVAVGVGCQGTVMDSITYAVWAFGTAKTGRLLTVSRIVLLKSTSLEGLTEEDPRPHEQQLSGSPGPGPSYKAIECQAVRHFQADRCLQSVCSSIQPSKMVG